MKVTKSQLAIIAIIVMSFALSIYFYPQLPDKMATHWNAKGEVDDHMGKEVGAFIMPVVMTVTVLIFLVILRIDPLKKNIEKFKSYYYGFIIAMCLFLFGIHWWMMLWNIGVKVSVNRVMPAAIGALYFFIGYIMKNFKRNWFMGIRTPWTLSNEVVWKRTHEVSGRLFMASSVIAMCGVFFPEYSLLLILVPILATAVFALVYSYVVYKKVSNAELNGTADEMRIGEGSGDTTWDNIKEGYLYQVERSLLKVKHPAKKQVLEDVNSHLDRRYDELSEDERTWENFQQIITEMGPATDYAELLTPETLAGSHASSQKSLMGIVVSVVAVIVTVIVLVTVLSNKQGAYELQEVSNVENLGHPFENDPEAIGYWKSVDFVEVVEDFVPETKSWKGDLFLKDFTFKPNGRTSFSWTWTKDWVWHSNGRAKAQYNIKQMAGETYLFLPWLSDDVTIRHQKPSYYVLKKLTSQTPQIEPTPGVYSAIQWLELIDNGNYGASWEEAVDIFKNAATKEQWEGMAKTVRQPLGPGNVEDADTNRARWTGRQVCDNSVQDIFRE